MEVEWGDARVGEEQRGRGCVTLRLPYVYRTAAEQQQHLTRASLTGDIFRIRQTTETPLWPLPVAVAF